MAETTKRAANPETQTGPIVFYDGECGMCARWVQWMLRHDRQGAIRFAPLQGETARGLIGAPTGPTDEWSIVLYRNGESWDRSTAALKMLGLVGWGGGLPKLLLATPRALRDGVYRLVAKFRMRVYGTSNSCALPTKEQRAQFLP